MTSHVEVRIAVPLQRCPPVASNMSTLVALEGMLPPLPLYLEMNIVVRSTGHFRLKTMILTGLLMPLQMHARMYKARFFCPVVFATNPYYHSPQTVRGILH